MAQDVQHFSPEELGEGFRGWLETKLSDASDVVVESVTLPKMGASNLTVVFDASWEQGGARHSRSMVGRIQPDAFQLFYDMDIFHQSRVMRAIAANSDIPVPEVLWEEPSAELFGSPFYVMGKIEGRVPPDDPSYHVGGWVSELTPGEGELLLTNALEQQARINMLRPEDGFEFLAPADGRAPGLVSYLDDMRSWATWAVRDFHFPVVDVALEYLGAHRPDDAEARVLWGDTGPRNMLFADDLSVAAVLDWENATLGAPEIDLGWWIMMDTFWSTAMGFERAPGMFGPEETIARYEDLIGRRVHDIGYYEILAWLRFELVIIRNFSLQADAGTLAIPVPDFVAQIPIDTMLKARLAEAGYRVEG